MGEPGSSPNDVMKLKKKGLVGDGGVRGDLYVRLAVTLPQIEKGGKSIELKAPGTVADKHDSPYGKPPPKLAREDPIELREGSAWKQWHARESAISGKSRKKEAGKSEL